VELGDYNAYGACRVCGTPILCMDHVLIVDSYELRPVNCETGVDLPHCPICGEGGRWWEEELWE